MGWGGGGSEGRQEKGGKILTKNPLANFDKNPNSNSEKNLGAEWGGGCQGRMGANGGGLRAVLNIEKIGLLQHPL